MSFNVGKIYSVVVMVLLLTGLVASQAHVAVASSVIPGYVDVYLHPSNPEGIAFNYLGNGTYYLGGGGFNAVHMSNVATTGYGGYTITNNQSGDIYVSNTGGRVYQDDTVLLLAVNGTIPDDFKVHITTSGYSWIPSSQMNVGPAAGAYTYNPVAINDTFTKADFIYGPQNWKPTGDNAGAPAAYPLFPNENQSDPSSMCYLMLVDTHTGLLTNSAYGGNLVDYGNTHIHYSFENLHSYAFFNVYDWNNVTTWGQSMGWENSILPGQTGGPSGYQVIGIPAIAPEASFTSDVTSGMTPLTVQFIDTSSNAPFAWSWDFGDGQTSTLQNPVHTYTTAGNYTVSLTATNDGGSNTAAVTDSIIVNAQPLPSPSPSPSPVPVTSFTSDVTSGTAPLTVQFTDTSSNVPTSWAWDFGDGAASTDQNPVHTFSAGTYNVTLTASNVGGAGAPASAVITVSPPVHAPVAGFMANVTSGLAPLTVQFTDMSSNSPASWSWDFGDGATSNLQNPVHTYAAVGNYTVGLTATNTGGSGNLTKAGCIMALTTNRFVNPGFETGNLSGWTAGSVNGVGATHHNGTYGLHFDYTGSQSNDFIQQSIDLTAVSSFSFWGYGESTTNPFYIYIDGVQVAQVPSSSNVWTQITIPVNYTGVHTIAVKWQGGSYGSDADDFSTNITNTIADFSAAPTNGRTPLTVQFTDKSIGLNTQWAWDFNGDGVVDSTVQNPTYTYTQPGNYTVAETVTGPFSSSTKTLVNLVSIVPPTNLRTGKTYDSIQAAIDDPATQAGDTIRVGNGPYLETYRENVILDKQLNLVTNGNVTITAASSSSPAISVPAAGAGSTITGFTITGATGSDGIYVAPAANAVTTGNVITGNGVGVFVDGGSATLSFNDIYGNSQYGLQFTGIGVSAAHNWWGTNSPAYVSSTTAPGAADVYEAQTSNQAVDQPWMNLNVSVSSSMLKAGALSSVSVDLAHDSTGADVSAQGYVPSTPVTFQYSLGSLTNTVAALYHGAAGSQITAGIVSGTDTVNVALAGCTVNIPVTVDTVAPAVSVNVPGGAYNASQTVTISSNDPTATIFYTINGGTPTANSTLYSGPITVNSTCSIKIMAVDPAGNWGPMITVNYVIGSTISSDSMWKTYQKNVQHTGQATVVGPQTNNTFWNYTLGGSAYYGSPVVGSDGTIYIGCYDYKLYAMNHDGSQKWNFTTGGYIYGTPTIGSDGTIYIGSYDKKLYAVNPDGSQKWNYTTGGYIYGSATIGSDGTIYIGSYDKKLYAVNPDGSQKWNYTTGNYIYCRGGSPAIGADGTIYFGDYDKYLYAMNPDGTLKWKFLTGNYIYGSPAVGADGTIYIGSYDKKLYAINPDGSPKWNATLGNYIYGTPAVGSDGTVYIGSYDGKLYAYNPDGSQKWNYTAGSYIYGAPIIGADGTVYFGCYNKNVYALSASGSLKWSYTTGSYIYGSPCLGPDGILYIGGYDKKLYAFYDSFNFTPSVTNGLYPMTVNFTATAPNVPTNWSWDFGDGTTSSVQNPSHVFQHAGNYTVSLAMTNNTGTFTYLKPNLISVYNFAASQSKGNSPLAVQFTDLSEGSPSAWLWQFGDGATSTEQNPLYTYIVPGSYTVNLTTTTAAGTLTTYNFTPITVLPHVPCVSISANVTAGVKPLAVQLNDSSYDAPPGYSNATSWLWNFGDGDTSTVQNNTHVYYNSGNYTVNFTATNAGGSNATSMVIAVREPSVNFTANVTSGVWPLSVQFTDTSGISPTSWSWDFGDGNTSTLQNPMHTYSQAGVYNVTLNAVGTGGSDAMTKPYFIAVNPPYVNTEEWNFETGKAYPGVGTWGSGIVVTTTTSAFDGNYSLQCESNNGIGYAYAPVENVSDATTFTCDYWVYSSQTGYGYTSMGIFVVDASGNSIAGMGGNDNTIANTDSTTICNRPSGAWLHEIISWNKNTGVITESVYDTSGALLGTNTQTRAATVGKIPAYLWFNSRGYTVDHIVRYDDVKFTSGYDPAGNVRANFSSSSTVGGNPLSVNFTDLSSGTPTGWLWDFGDNTSTPRQNPTHKFTAPGYYTVKLTTYYGSATAFDEKYQLVGVAAPDFVANVTSGVVPLTVKFTDNSTGPVQGWSWDFNGDGVADSTAQNPTYTFLNPGTYTVNLTVVNPAGNATASKAGYITVSMPNQVLANFTADTTFGRMPLTVQFTDLSTGANITRWAWDFGDGSTSTLQNASHTYTAAGAYNVSLTAASDASSNTVTKASYVQVAVTLPPSVSFTANQTMGRAPLTVQFNDTSSYGPTAWIWDFGDGNTSTLQSPVHVYSALGNYDVTLTATNGDGSSTLKKAGLVSVVNLTPLSNYRDINVYVANDGGVKYDVPNGVSGGTFDYSYVPNTYFVYFRVDGGGLNPIHISTANTGAQVTTTTNQSGTFYITFTGGQPTMPEAILMLAVNGTVPDDFALNVKSSGYTWNMNPPLVGNNFTTDNLTYVAGALNETFTKNDFRYGPQVWKPSSLSNYPIYEGQNMSDPNNSFQLMFIDLNVGALQSGTDNGAIRVDYNFTDLQSMAAFNVYGWYSASNHGTGIIMTNSYTGGDSGYNVIGVQSPLATTYPVVARQGWNIVAFPIQNATLNASSIPASSGVDQVAMYDGSAQLFKTYLPGVSHADKDFALTPDVGYFLNATRDNASLTFNGVPVDSPRTLTLYPSWNVIGWSPSTSSTASAFGALQGNITTIGKYDPVTGLYSTYVVGISHADKNFQMSTGNGYFVYTNAANTVNVTI